MPEKDEFGMEVVTTMDTLNPEQKKIVEINARNFTNAIAVLMSRTYLNPGLQPNNELVNSIAEFTRNLNNAVYIGSSSESMGRGREEALTKLFSKMGDLLSNSEEFSGRIQ